MAKVMEGRPWCFDSMLILVKATDGEEQLDQVLITHSSFWVRIKNIPFNYQCNEIIRDLSGNTSEILDIEEDVLGIGIYMRVKVLFNVTKPLRHFWK